MDCWRELADSLEWEIQCLERLSSLLSFKYSYKTLVGIEKQTNYTYQKTNVKINKNNIHRATKQYSREEDEEEIV